MTIKTIDLGRKYSVAEFVRMPEFNERYELLDGELVEKPMPKVEHGLIQSLIMMAVRDFNPAGKLGLILPEIGVYVDQDYAPIPDLSFWVAERKPARKAEIGPIPDLAIEIQSPEQSLPALITKARRYLEAGTKLVWIIQPDKQIVLVLRQGQDAIETVQLEGELDGEKIIPGFKLPLKKLFE